jgi:hypothetical protein
VHRKEKIMANPFSTKSLPAVWGDTHTTKRGDKLPVIRVLAPSGRVMTIFPEHGKSIARDLKEFLNLLKAQVQMTASPDEEVEVEKPKNPPEAVERPPKESLQKKRKQRRGSKK